MKAYKNQNGLSYTKKCVCSMWLLCLMYIIILNVELSYCMLQHPSYVSYLDTCNRIPVHATNYLIILSIIPEQIIS